jgi:hypothetical protein
MSPQKKQRRELNDSLAKDFVFGGETADPPPKPKPSAKAPQPDDEKTIRFTADLPESLHQKLSILAARTGKKKVAIVRELLTEALKDVQ